MPVRQRSLVPRTNELKKSGQVVGLTDRVYDVDDGKQVAFEEVVVRGDLSGVLEYNAHTLKVVEIREIIGLEISAQGARGPVWKGVVCEVLA